jgi:endonuclease/exonuclease/phosphatase family metal-dependent hydrolase
MVKYFTSILMRKIYIILLVFSSCSIFSQENVRIMTYNLLNYPDIDSAIRNPHFRKVIRNSNPDILVVQEMTSQAGMNGFLSNVMNLSGSNYSMGTFIDGPDTDNGIFFKTGKFIFISNTRIPTLVRDINQFKIIHVNYPADTLRIYSVHLKSSTGIENENERAAEVDSLRKRTNLLPPGASYIVAGDFNIYGSQEQAYIKLLQVNGNSQGHFIDPIPNMTGTWNNSAYAQYHTQSPRVRGFGGGSTGGMDDRFDMILFSQSINSGGRIAYIPNSVKAYGNDGNHYNDSINQRPNTAVPDSIADALHYAADHLPVFATFTFGNSIGITPISNIIPDNFKLEQNYPNPFNPTTRIKFSLPHSTFTFLTVYDNLGRTVTQLVNQHLNAGEYEIEFIAEKYSSGAYYYRLVAEDYVLTRKMILVK